MSQIDRWLLLGSLRNYSQKLSLARFFNNKNLGG